MVAALVTLGVLVLVDLAVLALDWTTALSLIGGGMLIALGAMWPALWLASVLKQRREGRRGAIAGSPSSSAASTAQPAPAQAPVRISVLVPARNEAAVIRRMVSQLRAQSHGDFEAIIVANNCTDDTASLARRVAAGDSRFKVLEASFAGGVKADALNLALPQTEGDVVVLLDADNVVGADFLENIASAFREPATRAVQTAIRALNAGHGILPRLQDVEFQVYSEVFNAGRVAVGFSSSIGGTGFAIRTALLRELGGWSRHLVEDFELHLRLARAGIKVGYLGSTVVYDEKPSTWGALINQRRRWIRGHVSLALSPRTVQGLPFHEIVYLYSPLGIALSMVLLCLGYATSFAPGLLPPFAYLSPGFWLLSIVATGVMLSVVTHVRGQRIRFLSLLGYLFVFGFHWVVVMFAALLPASWATTKTVHGRGARRGIAGYLGVDGARSAAVLAATVVLAGLWFSPLAGALASPYARAHMLSPIQFPVASNIAVTSVIERAEAAETASVSGSVVSAATGAALSGAHLTLSGVGATYSATSDSSGAFSITAEQTGTYTFTASKAGYVSGSCRLSLASGESVNVLVMLSQQHGGVVYIVPVPY